MATIIDIASAKEEIKEYSDQKLIEVWKSAKEEYLTNTTSELSDGEFQGTYGREELEQFIDLCEADLDRRGIKH